jgi:hypothetical protein
MMQSIIAYLFLHLLHRCFGATYYISPEGSDSNTGTSSQQPWLTTKNVNSMETVYSDDRILFESVDHYQSGGLVIRNISRRSPDSLSLLTVSSYAAGGLEPVTASATLNIDASSQYGFAFFNVGMVQISNIVLISSVNPFDAAYEALYFYSADQGQKQLYRSIRVSNFTAAGFNAGVTFDAESCFGFEDVILSRVYVLNNLETGISSYGYYNYYLDVPNCYSHANFIIDNCTAFNNTGNPKVTDSNTGSGIVLAAVDGAVIQYSLAHHNGAHNGNLGGGPYGIWTWISNNVLITHCVSHSNMNGFPPFTPGAIDGGGLRLGRRRQ